MKKAIVLTEKNRDRIQAILDEVQEKSKARTITFDEMKDAALRVTRHLDIPTRRMKGVKALIDINAQRFPSSYKFTPYSTQFEIEHGGSEWRIIRIERLPMWKSTKTAIITLTADAEAAVIERAEKLF